MTRRILCLFLALPLLAQAQFSPSPLPKPLQNYPNAARLQFGYITVPEDHANPGNGRTIRLAVVIVPALGATPDPDPVFYIVGGPGGGATFACSGVPVFEELNKTRDIVFVDPRGAGLSEPNLYMRKGGSSNRKFASANRAWFAQNDIDVSTYNTTQVAEDYEAARVALGYSDINLFASSYGTFVAQEILRRHPANLRSVVMSGNSPATDPFLPTTLANEKAGIEALIRDVSTNAAARAAFPRFRQRFYKLLDKVNAKPVKVLLPNLDTGRYETVTIDGSEFVQTMVEMLQRTKYIRCIPALVREMETRNSGPLMRRFFGPRLRTKIDNPFGMYLSVLGSDFAAPGYAKATERGILRVKNKSLVSADGPLISQLAQLVVMWGVPYQPGTTRTLPDNATTRVLFLNGMMDGQTPVSGGATIARTVTNSINYVYPRIGHAVGFLDGPDMDAAAAFVRNPAQFPAFSTRGLKTKRFYITSDTVPRVRVPENWRDSLIDPPVRPFVPSL